MLSGKQYATIAYRIYLLCHRFFCVILLEMGSSRTELPFTLVVGNIASVTKYLGMLWKLHTIDTKTSLVIYTIWSSLTS